MKTIIVTGTPGTGKTTLSIKLSKELGFRYVDVNRIIEENDLSTGYDRKRDCKIVDTDRLNDILRDLIRKSKRGLVIDSHLSHNLPSDMVDRCIVTKCDISKLKKRLAERDYNNHKIRENLDAEILDVCLNEAVENGHNVEVIYT